MNPRCLGIALFVAAGICPAVACINTGRVSQPPPELPVDLFPAGSPHIHIPVEALKVELPLFGGTTSVQSTRSLADARQEYERIIQAYEANPTAFTAFEDHLDYAAALIYAGRAADAIPVLEMIEREFPGRYATASNLGTAYELVGDVPNAKAWIQQGIERNPDSHKGTEWLHVAILETKLKLKDDPKWLASHSVLDGERDRKTAETELALEYQLNERLFFIKEKDPIMSDLFFEAAKLTTNPAKRTYFIKQAKAFASLRNDEIKQLQRAGRL